MASGEFGGMGNMHWLYYVLVGAAVIVLVNVVFVLILVRASHHSQPEIAPDETDSPV
jgi:hypothetical protein